MESGEEDVAVVIHIYEVNLTRKSNYELLVYHKSIIVKGRLAMISQNKRKAAYRTEAEDRSIHLPPPPHKHIPHPPHAAAALLFFSIMYCYNKRCVL